MNSDSFDCCRDHEKCAAHCGNWQQCPARKIEPKPDPATEALQLERQRTILLWQSAMIGTALHLGITQDEILAVMHPDKILATVTVLKIEMEARRNAHAVGAKPLPTTNGGADALT